MNDTRDDTGGVRDAGAAGDASDTSIRDFESALAELEAIVRTLEQGDLTLEQSLERFERGVRLSRFCHTRLADAERRVEVLTEQGDIRPAPPGIADDGAAEPAAGAESGSGLPDDDIPF